MAGAKGDKIHQRKNFSGVGLLRSKTMLDPKMRTKDQSKVMPQVKSNKMVPSNDIKD